MSTDVHAPSARGFARRGAIVLVAIAVLVVIAAFVLLGGPARGLVGTRVRAMAASRGLDATWTTLRVAPPLTARFTGLTVTRRSDGAMLFHADSLDAHLDPWALAHLETRLARLDMAGAAIHASRSTAVDPDTLAPDDEPKPRRGDDPARAAHLRDTARQLIRLLAAPARSLPRLTLRNVELTRTNAADDESDAAPGGAANGVHVDAFTVVPDRGGVRIAARGTLLADPPVPFTADLDYGRDDRLAARAVFQIQDDRSGDRESLQVWVAGKLHQDRRAGRVTIVPPTRLEIGTMRFGVSGVLDRAGPSFRLALDADSLTAEQWHESLPHAVLGPLEDLAVRGWYGYHLKLDLDVSRPDSVTLAADVVPHGLTIDPSQTRLRLLGLDQPFVARIHLPHDRIVERELSYANPHFLTLSEIDSLLVRAVMTNEDGSFFHHQGFNLEAVRGAIADNIKAGAFRRGAGTITMQLVRNLYLGHRRTLSRKGQEVVLAWVLEHLTPITKERMLEIYLNIIEWGPDVHGADEAAWYYLGHDARRLTIDEALFLATVIPAPTKWRYRFDSDGVLRPYARAQMHFIGRAMVARGWLPPEALPPADQLHVEIRGPAREVLMPHAESPA